MELDQDHRGVNVNMMEKKGKARFSQMESGKPFFTGNTSRIR